MTFTIPYPRTDSAKKTFGKQYSLNAIYRGKRQAERSKDARYWHELVRAELASQKIPKKPYAGPVMISFYWNDGLDCSNHAYIAKMIEDALKGWLIHDDNRKYVKGILHWFSDKDCITVEVTPL